jgi:hypothetical protein
LLGLYWCRYHHPLEVYIMFFIYYLPLV